MYLGINAFFHDASAAIVDRDGRIIAAAQEERFTHKKREGRFPVDSIKYCLKEARININELEGIGFAWDPKRLIFQRILWLNLFRVPASWSAIQENIQKIKGMWAVPKLLKEHFGYSGNTSFRYFRHHACHAANAYFASPFEQAAFMTIDGGGEVESITWGKGKGGSVVKLGQSYFPDSIGKVYSGTCRFLGFSGAEKDGTVMALAAFGEPKFVDIFRKIIKPIKDTNSLKVKVDASYFDFYSTADIALSSKKFSDVFGIPARKHEEEVTQIHKDIAASLQKVTEEVIVELLQRLHLITGETNLVLSGGVALNSVLNGKLEKISAFKNVFIQPAASDAGLSLGAAYLSRLERNMNKPVPMETAALGPSYSDEECREALEKAGLKYEAPQNLTRIVAQAISEGKIIAWFQGRMEFGPRALGQRSLLGDARLVTMLDKLNEVKKREKFRPFAISILEEKAHNVLESIDNSPFMLMVDTVKSDWRNKVPSAQHIDGSVRIQTLNKKRDGLYYDLVQEFDKLTGVPLIINTSLNIKGQPIVCTPSEAIETFVSSSIDVLVMGPYLIYKK